MQADARRHCTRTVVLLKRTGQEVLEIKSDLVSFDLIHHCVISSVGGCMHIPSGGCTRVNRAIVFFPN